MATLPKFDTSPLKSYRLPIGNDRLPTPFFQGRTCSTSGVDTPLKSNIDTPNSHGLTGNTCSKPSSWVSRLDFGGAIFPQHFSVCHSLNDFPDSEAMSVKEKLRAVHAKAVKRQFQEVSQRNICFFLFFRMFVSFFFKDNFQDFQSDFLKTCFFNANFNRSLELFGAPLNGPLKPYPNSKGWNLGAPQKRSIHLA